MLKKILLNVVIFAVTVAVGLGAAELMLRIKNADQKNYNIEMWRYSKLLKRKSDNPILGHEHVPNCAAKLQGVDVRINSFGMRGPAPAADASTRRRILFLGSSNTLGWGVPEEKTMTSLLQNELGAGVQIYNGGIGNYNARRYVELLDKRQRHVQPNIVVVNYFIRDAEVLTPGGGNFLLRHSELAVILYHLFQNLTKPYKGLEDLVAYYKKMYQPDSEGRIEMEAALKKLDAMSKEMNFKVVFTVIPDIHLLHPYPFQFMNDEIKKIAARFNWTFVDFTEELSRVESKSLWAMPGDPHVNSLGHQIMARKLATHLR